MENHRDWLELANKCFDQSPISVDALFVHGWGDLHDEIIAHTAKLYKEAGAKLIILNGEDVYDHVPDSPGYQYWFDALTKKYGVPAHAITHFKPGRQTREEGEGFMKIAQEKSLKSAAIISVPQHIMRAFLTDLGVMQKMNMDLKLYPRTLPGMDWNKHILVAGLFNGGKPEDTTRFGRLVSECIRIVEYRKLSQTQPDHYTIATVAEALKHLSNI
jgi:hypothetical protein